MRAARDLRAAVAAAWCAALVTGCGAAEVDLPERVRGWGRSVPPPQEGVYSAPTAREAEQLATGVRLARRGALERAGDVLAGVDYRVEEVVEAGSGQRVVLVEPVEGGASERAGWGRYAVRPGSASRLLVEVPHPRSDLRTDLVGAEVFVEAQAGALLVAGAHRDAADDADVADEPGSALHAVQQALVEPGDVVLQVHGFDADSHPARYGDAVVSDGRTTERAEGPSADTARLAAALAERDLDVCLQHRQDCSQLAGTRNVQGRAARELGASFVHLELALGARDDPDVRRSVARAVREALTVGS